MLYIAFIVIGAIFVLLSSSFAIYRFARYIHAMYFKKTTQLNDHSKLPNNVNLEPIFETNHRMDLNLEDPVLNASMQDDKKVTDFDNIESANLPGTSEKEQNTSSENSVEFKDLGDQLVKSETELRYSSTK